MPDEPTSVHHLDDNDPVAAAIFECLVRWEHSPEHVATKAAALLRKHNLVSPFTLPPCAHCDGRVVWTDEFEWVHDDPSNDDHWPEPTNPIRPV